jgi:hypothetical protein
MADKPENPPAEPSDEALIPKTTYGDQRDIRSDIAEAKEAPRHE